MTMILHRIWHQNENTNKMVMILLRQLGKLDMAYFITEA